MTMPAAQNDEKPPIVVLGAGPAGLATAWQLARRGRFAVTVLEKSGMVGGNAGSFDLEGCAWTTAVIDCTRRGRRTSSTT